MLKLIVAMGITVIGAVILLTFIKPSEKEMQGYKEFDKAKKDLFDAFVQSFKIDKFVEWLSKKLK